jgi:hypothetical protein
MILKDLYPALRAFMLGDAALSAAVGAQRIHVNEMPAGQTADSVVLQEVSAAGDHHNEGPSGLARPRVQITAWSKDRDAARALGRLVRARLDGARGTMGSGADAVDVQGVFFDSARFIKDDAAKLFGASADYFVNFEER